MIYFLNECQNSTSTLNYPATKSLTLSQAFQFSRRIGFRPRNTQYFTPVASPPKLANESIARQIVKMAGEVKFIEAERLRSSLRQVVIS